MVNQMDKEVELQNLKERMEKDDLLPLKKGATRLVFGVGNPNSPILCIGEGPGYWEDQKGEPFVGNAGKLLDSLLQSIKLDRTKVYITNVVHHRPPENRDPLPEEINEYGKYLDNIIEIIDPKIVLTLGRYSMGKFLPGVKITSVHGKLHKVNWQGRNLIVVPMYHPAAALRSGEVMSQEKEDFMKLPEMFKKLGEEKEEAKKEEIHKNKQMNLI
jgi:DNA polymerase